MAYTVKVSFDGLFVFVHRPTLAQPRLVVLMANTKEHHPSHQSHREHPQHDLWISVNKQPQQAFTGHLDLSSIGLTGGSAIIECALPLSSKTGECVEEKFLTGDITKVDKKIEGRVVLPLPISVAAVTSVEVEWEEAKNVWVKIEPAMSGHIELTYEANGPITVPGHSPTNGDATIEFTHLPAGSKIEPHPAHTPLKHSHMHSPIFKDKAPTFRTHKDFNPPPTDQTLKSVPESVLGGDPVVCTSGNGCPPELPNCGEG